MSTNLTAASNQWASRPDDERFESLPALLAACEHDAGEGKERAIDLRDMRFVGEGRQLHIEGKRSDRQVHLTHHAMSQLCAKVGAPHYYLASLPGELAARALQHGVQSLGDDGAVSKGLFRVNGSMTLRALTSLRYDRVWDRSIVQRAMDLQTKGGWRVPPARPARPDQKGIRKATKDDVLPNPMRGLGISIGDDIAPAGLYRGDKDLFIFMVDESQAIQEPGATGPKFRGFFLRNSEVGAATLELTLFLYDSVCGNHIVWGASSVKTIRARHIDLNATKSFADVAPTLRAYSETSAADTVKMLTAARTTRIAATREKVIDAVYAKRYQQVGKAQIAAAYDIADGDTSKGYGDPRTVYAIASGLTEYSQSAGNADARHAIDVAAGKLLATVA